MSSSEQLPDNPSVTMAANRPKQTKDSNIPLNEQRSPSPEIVGGCFSSLAQSNLAQSPIVPTVSPSKATPLSKEEFLLNYRKLVQAGIHRSEIAAALLASNQGRNTGDIIIETNERKGTVTPDNITSILTPTDGPKTPIPRPSSLSQQLQPARVKIEVDRAALLNRYEAASGPAPAPVPPVVLPEQQNQLNGQMGNVRPVLQRGREILNGHYDRWLAVEMAQIFDVLMRAFIFGIIISPGDWSRVAAIVVISLLWKVAGDIIGKLKFRVRNEDHNDVGDVTVRQLNGEGSNNNGPGGVAQGPLPTPCSIIYKIYYIISKCLILFVVSMVPTFTLEGLENELLHDGIVRQRDPVPQPVAAAVPEGPNNGNLP